MKKTVIVTLLLTYSLILRAQESSTLVSSEDKLKIGYEAYIDFHYTYDFNRPYNRVRKFDSNPEYVNQFGLAYTYGQVYVDYGKFRAKVGVHAGDIVDTNVYRWRILCL